mgnify:CR=1 FL=1
MSSVYIKVHFEASNDINNGKPPVLFSLELIIFAPGYNRPFLSPVLHLYIIAIAFKEVFSDLFSCYLYNWLSNLRD